MSADWALAVSVIAALAALLTLGHRIVVQLLGRIDILSTTLREQIDQRFADAERIRAESTHLHQERLLQRDQAIAALRADFESHRADALGPQGFVRRETWIESEGRNMIKLDKILDRLNQLDPAHG